MNSDKFDNPLSLQQAKSMRAYRWGHEVSTGLPMPVTPQFLGHKHADAFHDRLGGEFAKPIAIGQRLPWTRFARK